MSYQTRPKPTGMTICDLCDKEIADRGLSGSLIGGYISHEVRPGVERVYFLTWLAEQIKTWNRSHARPPERGRKYDFHYDCIERLVRETVDLRERTSSDRQTNG